MLDYSAAAMLNALGTGETGAGITIGILSDSFDLRSQAADEMASGDLPAVKVLSEGPDGQDEGREMALLIHAIAPGATILFAAAFPPDGMVGMGRNIDALVAAGCNILVDDIFNTSEPKTGSPIELAIERCVAAGVSYFTAIGNLSQFGTVAHAYTPGANAVGAIQVGKTVAAPYSSPGPVAFLGPDGTRAPDFTALAFGTSFAVANDAAAAALVLQAAPKLTPAQLTAILKQSCSMIPGDPQIVGAGLPDIKKAVALAQATLDPTPVPAPAPKPAPVPVVAPAPVTIPVVPVAPSLPRQPEGGISVVQPGAPKIDYGVSGHDHSMAHVPSWRAAHIFCEINGVMW